MHPGEGIVAVHDLQNNKELFTVETAPWTTHITFMDEKNIAYVNKKTETVCVIDIDTGKHLKCIDFKVFPMDSSVYEIPQTVASPENVSLDKKPLPITVKGLGNGTILALYKSLDQTKNREGLLYYWSINKGVFTELDAKSITAHSALLIDDKLIYPRKKEIYISNPSKIQSLSILSGHDDTINSMSQSFNKVLASSAKDKTVRIWDVHRKLQIRMWEFPNGMSAISFHPTNQYILAIAEHGVIHFLDLRSKKEVASSKIDSKQALRSLRWQNEKILYAQIGLRSWMQLADLDKILPTEKINETL